MTFNEFKERANEKFGGKYEYLRECKDKNNTYIEYKCPKHGIIRQTKYSHLKSKFGCKKCADECYRKYNSNQELIDDLKKLHGDKYEYIDVDYTNLSKPLKIRCKITDEYGEHGIFYQKYANHFSNKEGCPICGKTHGMTLDRFINKANVVHNFKYRYDKSEYIDSHTKIKITCEKHGDFLQTPNDHLSGCGCPKCNRSHMENEVAKILNKNKIEYEEQKQFVWLVFKSKGKMKLDFYLPKYNIAVECQGEQHFKPIDYFNGKEKFEILKERDECKRKLCIDNGIKIEYINFYDNIEDKINEIIGYVRKKQDILY